MLLFNIAVDTHDEQFKRPVQSKHIAEHASHLYAYKFGYCPDKQEAVQV